MDIDYCDRSMNPKYDRWGGMRTDKVCPLLNKECLNDDCEWYVDYLNPLGHDCSINIIAQLLLERMN